MTNEAITKSEWAFPELSAVDNLVIIRARNKGYAAFYPCMNGPEEQAKKTLESAKVFLKSVPLPISEGVK